jgi:alkylation response protein AidB-like acyl-CoA dehydrogenase
MNAGLAALVDSVRTVVNSMGLAPTEQACWPQVTGLGWLLADVPEDLGGLGLGLPAICAIQLELGRGLAAAPYPTATLAIDAVCRSSLDGSAPWIESILAGTLATAPLGDSAVQMSRSGRLAGHAHAVPSADQASHILVHGVGHVALVRSDAVQMRLRPTWDATRRLYDVVLPAEGVTPDLLLATGDSADVLCRRLAARLDLVLAADSVGGASALLDLTVDYLKTRRQFGRVLASFQALKHRCADLKVAVAAAEALLQDALARPAGSAHEAGNDAQAMGAKLFACSVFTKVAEEAIQLHGGIAMTADHPCHLFLKRAQLNENLGWNRQRHELEIAGSLMQSCS